MTSETENDAAIARILQEREEAEAAAAASTADLPPIVQARSVPAGRGYPGRNRSAMTPSSPPPYHDASSPAWGHVEQPSHGRATSSSSSPSYYDNTFRQNMTHMCVVPCILGHDNPARNESSVCVEMMIDTGAQVSVMSLSLARRLHLEGRIDGRHQGMAAGVGQARIVGRLSRLPCTLGHVEFYLDVYILDTESAEPLLLLGLDLMRQYKCVVNLERDVLIFGGHDGVEVPLLPPERQHLQPRRGTSNCPVM